MIFNHFLVQLENDGRNREADEQRAIAGQILIQSIRDYHKAKSVISRQNVAFKYHCRRSLDWLSDFDREAILIGKEAWEWFTKEPIPQGKGWTFRDVSEVLGYEMDDLRSWSFQPSTYRALKRLSKGSHRGRTVAH